jgi:hypothetical protein
MAFWTSALSEPKRQHRFLLRLPSLTTGGPQPEFSYTEYLARSVTKPSFTVTDTPHKFLGNTYYYPGIVEWNTITATIVNAVAPDGNALLYAALENMGYLKPDVQELITRGEQAPSTVNKDAALRALGQVEIEELTGEGATAGIWILNNAFITSATFGDLNYDTEDILNIELIMRYDWATYETGQGARAVAAAAGT